MPSLPLQTAGGGLISFGALRGRWLLVEFIHTRCTTYCSAQGGQFARLQRELALPIASDELALLSVSFDPAHDDAAALVSFQRLHGDHGAGWIATRPVDAADLTTLLRVFGVVTVPDGWAGSCTPPRSPWWTPTAGWSPSWTGMAAMARPVLSASG